MRHYFHQSDAQNLQTWLLISLESLWDEGNEIGGDFILVDLGFCESIFGLVWDVLVDLQDEFGNVSGNCLF